MKKKLLIYCLLFSCSWGFYGQTAIKKKADKAFAKMSYNVAYKEYSELEKENKLKNSQLLNLANSCYYTRRFKQAAEKYTTYLYRGGELSLLEMNRYFESLKRGGYKKALIEDAIDLRLNLFSKEIRERYKMSTSKNEEFSKMVSEYELKNLDINSKFSDFGVCFLSDSSVVFSSSRENKGFTKVYKSIKQPYINMYLAKVNGKGEIDSLSIQKFNKSDDLHFSSPSYDKNYDRIFYTQSVEENRKLVFTENKNTFRIVYGFMNGNEKDRELYNYPKKHDGYSYGQPYFDEKQSRLYFVSDRPGGYGGTDIYYVELKGEVIVSEPINLGENINTVANEMFPIVHNQNLYFSSNIFTGYGGLDVYKSEIKNNEFTLPVNMGEPINSIDDDFSYQISSVDDYTVKGYLSSNRKGGKGDDDIYSFIETKSLKKVEISGFAIEKKTFIKLSNAKVHVSDMSGKLINTFTTDSLGAYKVLLPIDQDYKFHVVKEGHVSDNGIVSLTGVQNLNPVDKDFYLEKELIEDKYGNVKINLEPVYFEYDDASITPRAEKQLQVAIDYLNKYPEDIFKLEAHTDSRGGKSYNLRLSERRAKSVGEYLLSKGIAPERIVSVKGFGETKLINECSDNAECTEEEHESNRRTDFVIVK
ncbi:hypothetical protein AXE80_12465 [Wenyingzhuangia fucanilytica]|uniref:OmpA-like domain-containing protein n=1 Tax=Wenyingzhuangia fucanilytica TaxID=1790137 RepID=A0A1B1Y8K4_9FLAO|nr:OmpA family protein [Wenyingzhuangia fucanilytica]ANW97048.1 hypothetical protein AXE80_12465 [Wenyingzhuangia fucanilytica]